MIWESISMSRYSAQYQLRRVKCECCLWTLLGPNGAVQREDHQTIGDTVIQWDSAEHYNTVWPPVGEIVEWPLQRWSSCPVQMLTAISSWSHFLIIIGLEVAEKREPSYIWRTEVLTVRDSDRYSVVGAGSITVLTPAHGEGRRNKHQLVRPGQRTSLGSANTMRNTLLSSSNTTDLWSQIKPTNSGCILVFAESNLLYFFSTKRKHDLRGLGETLNIFSSILRKCPARCSGYLNVHSGQWRMKQSAGGLFL